MKRLEASEERVVIDDEGWARSASRTVERVPSPNHDARPDDRDPDLLVIHNISLPPGTFGGRAVDALFTNTLDHAAHPYYEGLRGLRVSAHFLIRRDGALVQFVACGRRAWHAGVSSFGGRERCNDFSIGIELEGDDERPFAPAQYATLSALADALTTRYPIAAIAGHSEIAPGRKTDPGPFFDWSALMRSRDPALRQSAPPPPPESGSDASGCGQSVQSLCADRGQVSETNGGVATIIKFHHRASLRVITVDTILSGRETVRPLPVVVCPTAAETTTWRIDL